MEKKNPYSRFISINPKSSLKTDKKPSIAFITNIKSKDNSSKNKNNLTNRTSIYSENKFQKVIISKKSTSRDIVKTKESNDNGQNANQKKKIVNYLGKPSLTKNKTIFNNKKNTFNENIINNEVIIKKEDSKAEKSKSIVNRYYNFYLDDFIKNTNNLSENIQAVSSTKVETSNSLALQEKPQNRLEKVIFNCESSDDNLFSNENKESKKELIKININNNNYYSNSTLNQEKDKNEFNIYSVESENKNFNQSLKANNINLYDNKKISKWKHSNNNVINYDFSQLNNIEEKSDYNNELADESNKKLSKIFYEDEIEIENKTPFSTRFNNPSFNNRRRFILDTDKKDYRNIYFPTEIMQKKINITSDNNINNVFKRDSSETSYIPLSRKEKKILVEEMNQSSIQRMERYSLILQKLKNQVFNINDLVLFKEEEAQILNFSDIKLNKGFSDIKNINEEENKILYKLNAISDILSNKILLLEKQENNNMNNDFKGLLVFNSKSSNQKNINREIENNDFILSTSFNNQLINENYNFSNDQLCKSGIKTINKEFENIKIQSLTNINYLQESHKKSKISAKEIENINGSDIDILNESLESIEKKINKIDKIINKNQFQSKKEKTQQENIIIYENIIPTEPTNKDRENKSDSDFQYFKKITINKNENEISENEKAFYKFETPIKEENFSPSKSSNMNSYKRNVYQNKENSVIIDKNNEMFFSCERDSNYSSNVLTQSYKFDKNINLNAWTNAKSLIADSNSNNTNNFLNYNINSKIHNENINNRNCGNIKISLKRRKSSKNLKHLNDNFLCLNDKEIEEKTDEIKIPDSILISNQFCRLNQNGNLLNKNENNEERSNYIKKRNKFSYDLRIDSNLMKDAFDFKKKISANLDSNKYSFIFNNHEK